MYRLEWLLCLHVPVRQYDMNMLTKLWCEFPSTPFSLQCVSLDFQADDGQFRVISIATVLIIMQFRVISIAAVLIIMHGCLPTRTKSTPIPQPSSHLT